MLEIREKRLKKFTQDKDFSEKKKFTFNKNAKSESPKEDDIPKKFTFSAKGQLISKGHFGVFKSTKKTNEIFVRISALASKQWSNKRK